MPFQLGRQLRPSSDLFAELDQPPPAAAPVLAIWSDIDQLSCRTTTPGSGTRPDSDNELVHGVGHMSLPINTAIVQKVTRSSGS